MQTMAPPLPSGTLRVRAVPELPAQPPPNPLARLLPVLMLVAAGAMVVLYLSGGHGSVAMRSPMYLIFPVLMLVSVLGTVAHGTRGRRQEIDAVRRDYLRHLDTVAELAERTAVAQHVLRHWMHPDPAALWTLVGGERMWERRRGHPEFLRLRIGLGGEALATPLEVPDTEQIAEPDPVTRDALAGLLVRVSVVPGLPVTVDLDRSSASPENRRGREIWCGPWSVSWRSGTARPMCGSGPTRAGDPRWDWLKWLPQHGPAGPGVCTVLIVDDGGPPPEEAGVVVLDLGGRGEVVLTAGPDADALTESQARMCARRLAGFRTGADTGSEPDWLRLVGLDGPRPRVAGHRCGCRSESGTVPTMPGRQCIWTSGRPPTVGWARTGCASGPPGPVNPNCCGRSSSAWRPPTAPRN
jgi:S-DNA-T family DNA segregation ATPase FtsK/SpoIIIE